MKRVHVIVRGRVQGVYFRASARDRARQLGLRGWVRNCTDGSVEILADRLGIGSRHLSRLFQMHLGASPVQVAQTTRVQRAKRFLDETDLTMSEIAVRAGFGSLRRFNTVFAEVYRRPPTQIRRARKPSAT